jgi:hypothetical protein
MMARSFFIAVTAAIRMLHVFGVNMIDHGNPRKGVTLIFAAHSRKQPVYRVKDLFRATFAESATGRIPRFWQRMAALQHLGLEQPFRVVAPCPAPPLTARSSPFNCRFQIKTYILFFLSIITGCSEPMPAGVVIVAHVPLAMDFQSLP